MASLVSTTVNGDLKVTGSSNLFFEGSASSNTYEPGTRIYGAGITLTGGAYTSVFEYTVPGGLAGNFRFFVKGTTGNVVIPTQVDVLLNHSKDITIKSQTGNYTPLHVKVLTNNNEDCLVQLKADTSGNANVTVYIDVIAFGDGSVSFSSFGSYTGVSLEHKCNFGFAFSTINNTVASKFVMDGSNSGGRLGIGTNAPGYGLDVYGTNARVGTNLRLGNGTSAGNANDPAITVSGYTNAGIYFENSGVGLGAGTGKYLFLSSSGNVGIGITNPSQKLQVNGNITVNSQVIFSSGSNQYLEIGTNSIALKNSGGTVLWNSATALDSSTAWANMGAGTRTNYTLKFKPPGSGYAGFQFLGTNNNNAGYFLIRGTSSTDVYTAEGITLVADQGWLTLAQRTASSRGVKIMTGSSTSRDRITVSTDGDIVLGVPTNSLGTATTTTLKGYSVQYDSGGAGARLSNTGFLIWNTGGNWTGNERMWAFTNADNMGGGGGPRFTLLRGSNNSTVPTLGNNGSLGTNTLRTCFWTKDGNFYNSGSVGIGTEDPNATLDVVRGTATGGTAQFRGTTASSHFNYSTTERTYIRGGKTGAYVTINDSHNGDVLLANGGGDVGIGTVTPGQKLDVRGDILIKGPSTSSATHSVLRFQRGNATNDFATIGFENPALANDEFLISAAGNGNPIKLQAGTNTSMNFYIGTTHMLTLTTGALYPPSNGTKDLGLSGNRWNNVYSEAGNFSGLITSPNLPNKYNLPNIGNTASWVKLGNLSTSQSGRNLYLRIFSASGYNAAETQNTVVEVYFRTSNNSSTQSGTGVDGGNFYGSAMAQRLIGLGSNTNSPSVIRIVQVSTTSYDFYGSFNTFTGTGSFYEVLTNVNDTWTNSATTVSEPTSGTLITRTPSVVPYGAGSTGKVTVWDATYSLGYDTNLTWDFTNDRLGISDSSPSYSLDVNGDIRAQSDLYIGTGGGHFYNDSGSRIRTNQDFYTNNSNTYLYGNNTYLGASSGDVIHVRDNSFRVRQVRAYNGNGIQFQDDSGTEYMRLRDGGNVGIRVTAPTYALHVNGHTAFSSTGTVFINAALNGSGKGLVISSGTRTTSDNGVAALEIINRDGDNTLTATVAGNVGIGITTPSARLHVGNSTTGTEPLRLQKSDDNVSNHVTFYSATTRVGEIGCQDTTWLRINQVTNKNIYTPRMIRVDGGIQVDGSYVITGGGIHAGSGAQLTSLNAANLGSGRVPLDRMNLVLPTSGNYTWSNSTTAGNYTTGLQLSFVRGADGWPNYGTVLHVGGRGGTDAGGDFQLFCGHGSNYGGNYLRVRNADNDASPTDSWTDWRTIWDSGNDGSGSGLDADLLDGLEYNHFAYRASGGTGYYIVSSWLQFSGTYGLYWNAGVGAGWHIYPASTDSMRWRAAGAGVRSNLRLDVGSNNYGNLCASTTMGYGLRKANVNLSTDSDWDLLINTDGNVGIGTTGPGAKLEVLGDAIIGSAATKLKTYSDSTYSGIYNGSSLQTDEAVYFGSGSIYFYANATSMLRITSGAVFPTANGTKDLGLSGNRWNNVYSEAGNFSGTVTAGNISGNGSGLTSLNASNISSGTVAAARLGSGSSITTKFLRGDNTWQTVSSGSNPNNATITLSAGTNLSGGGNFTTNQSSNETITFNMATGGAGAGSYGSTANGTKIDTITLDAYGRVTGVATGTTGDILGVTAGTGLSGGGTSGTVTVSLGNAGAGAGTYGSTSDSTKIDTITLDQYGRVTAVATGGTGSGSMSSWNWGIDTASTTSISNGETVRIKGGTNVTVSRSGNDVTINASSGSTPNNKTITLSDGTGLSGGGSFTTNQSFNETITFNVDGTVCRGIDAPSGSATPSSGDFDFLQSGGITISASGNNVTFSSSSASDYRLKKNVTDFNSESWTKVKSVSCRKFDFDAEKFAQAMEDDYTIQRPASYGGRIGFIAHELEAAGIDGAVEGEKDGVDEDGVPIYQKVSYTTLVPVLWGALNEAIRKIEILESKVQALEDSS